MTPHIEETPLHCAGSFSVAFVKSCWPVVLYYFTSVIGALLTVDCVDFEDSLNVTPQTPYNPSLQPDRTILKPSPDTNNLIALMPSKQKSPRKRLKAADFF